MASVAIALLFVLLDQELNSAYIWQLELLSNCPEPYCRPLAKCFVTPGIKQNFGKLLNLKQQFIVTDNLVHQRRVSFKHQINTGVI